MSSSYGKAIQITIFGQSHSKAIGVTVDGLPAGIKIDYTRIAAFMARRAPGGRYSTARREADKVDFVSGVVNGHTCGAPLTALIYNTDADSSDYSEISDVPRPAHSDYTAYVKYGSHADFCGGGHFSGRLTAPLCVAGAVCIGALEQSGIAVRAHIKSIGDISDTPFDTLGDNRAIHDFPVINKAVGKQMLDCIENARLSGDSVGGVVECMASGVPAGLGEPIFGGIESRISQIIFGIPAVKGVEFGGGFGSSRLSGSENNDEFYMNGNIISTKTNNHGGILGGITSGMPITVRVAFKPTPSISLPQNSVSLSKKTNKKLTIRGRHDPCVVPRAVPCVEAAVAIALFDAYLESKAHNVNYNEQDE